MVDLLADGEDAAVFGFHEAGIGDGAGVVAHTAHPSVEASQAGVAAVVGLDADLQSCGKDGLAGGGGDFAFVADIGSDEHNAAAISPCKFGA